MKRQHLLNTSSLQYLQMNGSDFEQQEEGKPWQIKVILIHGIHGGTIGQQVRKSMKRQLNLK